MLIHRLPIVTDEIIAKYIVKENYFYIYIKHKHSAHLLSSNYMDLNIFYMQHKKIYIYKTKSNQKSENKYN